LNKFVRGGRRVAPLDRWNGRMHSNNKIAAGRSTVPPVCCIGIGFTLFCAADVFGQTSDTTSFHREFGTPAIQGQGFIIGVNATMILQGTSNPNAVTDATKNVADASYAAEVTFTKNFDKVNGKAFLRYEAGQGNGINQDLSLFCNANASAFPGQGIWVAEAWYEQKLFSDHFDGAIGYLFPAAYFDNNNAANDQTTQFLNSIFVNNPTFEMPVYAPGLVIKLLPLDNVEISGGTFDANGDWQRIGDNLFNVGQLSYSPVIFGSTGNYHIFGWYNRLPHRLWSDTSAGQENSYGFGLSIDQRITETITAFARFGRRSPNNYDFQAVEASQNYSTLISQSWSIGAQISGKPWHRKNDVAGIGFGQALPSSNYKAAMELANAAPESHFEIYYRIKCFEHMGISPDFQYIMGPFGKDQNPFRQGTIGNTPAIAIVGIRSMVDF
jgi:high affinity Mn2+ porin